MTKCAGIFFYFHGQLELKQTQLLILVISQLLRNKAIRLQRLCNFLDGKEKQIVRQLCSQAKHLILLNTLKNKLTLFSFPLSYNSFNVKGSFFSCTQFKVKQFTSNAYNDPFLKMTSPNMFWCTFLPCADVQVHVNLEV